MDGTGGWTASSQNTTTTLNVGIGITIPKTKLDVNGSINVTGSIYTPLNISIGQNSNANSSNAITIGANTLAAGGNPSIVIGNSATAIDQSGDSIVVGYSAISQGARSVTIGNSANVSEDGGIAIGYQTVAGYTGIALGSAAAAQNGSNYGIAIGNLANASGEFNSIAIGRNTKSSGDGSLAIGIASVGTSSGAIALGGSATASGSNAIAIGSSSYSPFTNSIAIGFGSRATTTTQFVVGNSSLPYQGLFYGIFHVTDMVNTSTLTITTATAGSCDLKAYTNGTVYCGTDSTTGDGTGGWTNTTTHTTTTIDVNITNSTGSSVLYVNTTHTRVGIGTNSPKNTLQVVGTANVTNLIISNNTAASCDLKADTSGNVYCGTDANSGGTGTGNLSNNAAAGYIPQVQNGTLLNNSAIFQSGTNIGIGTTAPSSKLDVNGNITVNSTLYFRDGDGSLLYRGIVDTGSGLIVTNSEIGGTVLGLQGSSGGTEYFTTTNIDVIDFNSGQFFLNQSSTSVGIGTSTPNLGGLNKTLTIASTRISDAVGIELLGNKSAAQATPGSVNFLNIQATQADKYIARVSGGVGTGGDTDSGMLFFVTANDSGTLGTKMTITENGTVGIGTTTPAGMLDIRQSTNGATIIRLENTNTGTGSQSYLQLNNGYANSYFALFGAAMTVSGYIRPNGTLIRNDKAGIDLAASDSAGDIKFWTGGGNQRMIIDSSGNVGIGTNNPTSTLEVYAVNPYITLNSTTGTGGIVFANGTNYKTDISWLRTTNKLQIDTNAIGTIFQGEVQILRNTNVSQLTIAGATAGSCDLKAYTNGTVYCGTDSTGTGTVTGTGTAGYVTLWNAAGNLNNSILYQNGSNIGFGITDPSYAIDINTTNVLSQLVFRARRANATNIATLSTDANGHATFILARNDGASLITLATSGDSIFNNSGNVGINVSYPSQKLHVSGNINVTGTIFYGGDLVGYGADFAEKFTMAEPVDYGDVVCLNDNSHIVKCSMRGQRSVAGVVSDRPTITGNAHAENSMPVGVVGIVTTKVKGPVARYDLLTTSSKKGYAEKATAADFGSIIGKAMEPCQSECEIKVLIGLR